MEYIREAIKIFKKYFRDNMNNSTRKWLGCIIVLSIGLLLISCSSTSTMEEMLNRPIDLGSPCLWIQDTCYCRDNAAKSILVSSSMDTEEMFEYCARS